MPQKLFQKMQSRLLALSRQADWKAQVRALQEQSRQLFRLFKSRPYSHPDHFFFSFDELPAMGKEYWFLMFSSPGQRESVVLTFGRAVSAVQVNATDVSSRGKETHSTKECAAVCWLYDGKKKVVLDSHARVSLDRQGRLHRLRAVGAGGNDVLIEGTYPRYRVNLRKNGRTIFTANVLPPRSGLPYEFIRLLSSPLLQGFGADMVNYYFRFSGTLSGRPVSGTAYLQKVLAVLPLAPWNWVRIQFSGGAVLDFFAAKPVAGQELHFACNDYFEWRGKRIKLGGLKLKCWGSGEHRRWVLEGPKMFMAMKSYALQPFAMRSATSFSYNEYLVQVTDFWIKADGKFYSLTDTGPGSGIVEDAFGYLL